MFDDSPPNITSSNGHAKAKRHSIHELMSNGVCGEFEHRIVEEDEGQATPVKHAKLSCEMAVNKSTQSIAAEDVIQSSPPSFSIASKDFATLSLDNDEEDEDWTRDEENKNMEVGNRLSSPNDLTCRRVSPITRNPLADVTHSGSTNGNHYAERPKADHTNLTPKFGTWGLGAKGVSEDWDNDFDFDTNDEGGFEDGNLNIENSVMLVPPAIQASQANVVGHVGQIREVCLLVEDLKRLRLLAREKNLMHGPSAQLWKEAEGIIALADVAMPGAPMEVLNRFGKPSGYVYDGNTVLRRSVFSPEDDIFGAGAIVHNPPIRDGLRPPLAPVRSSSAKTAAEVARTVMETMHQHRSTSDPWLSDMVEQSSNKMPFDTTSLRDLVHRASVLSRKLSDIIREADGTVQSPGCTPTASQVRHSLEYSPTQCHLRQNTSLEAIATTLCSVVRWIHHQTRNLGQRMHMMTVV
ncbi:hypothetical protein DID88_005060 [Monilinia fructigena]|uniref:Uncharacterized protein n=1 Tax=Monilinia fructigena TaxID=38457 RepID=A0A395IQB2_9HELO|nr:hypothetical protein DID88_005060 [Monilinia fructigena]